MKLFKPTKALRDLNVILALSLVYSACLFLQERDEESFCELSKALYPSHWWVFCLLCNQINLGDTLIVFDDLSSHIQKCKAVADVYIVSHLVFCFQAAYTVGGHSFSAAAIEYVILKMKPPVHRPQIVWSYFYGL